ncbi:DUF1365 domain-containing protein [Streptomyces naganishii]|uniref:DUF1365 domain-containing protein n=1 Tax=Streptomyces naganishii JCM 4654 TaxID=1306179 RepID=A0A918Y7A1_9ACTN|nr:DUF1365 domain-containing protein [Streptomyces naganishii]GHD93442.1 DUF1365 domain-containing protein [Streptomyces naganishii JCM 4654]
MVTAPTARPGPPALYPCTITHVRRAPKRYALRHRTYMWLIDPDRPPRLPRPLRPLARFRARDHFTGRAPSIRAALDGFLAEHGVDLRGGPVLMLAHARVLGHVFNPLTLYWCHGPDGAPRCVVAEVHNTYGQRHAYLLHTDASGTARTGKEFYVSPFLPVDGQYHMRLPPPGERLNLTVRLERPGSPPFTATVHGTRRAATVPALLRLALRRPWSTLAVSAAIRFHGIRLYLRGLEVQPRPGRRTPESAT